MQTAVRGEGMRHYIDRSLKALVRRCLADFIRALQLKAAAPEFLLRTIASELLKQKPLCCCCPRTNRSG